MKVIKFSSFRAFQGVALRTLFPAIASLVIGVMLFALPLATTEPSSAAFASGVTQGSQKHLKTNKSAAKKVTKKVTPARVESKKTTKQALYSPSSSRHAIARKVAFSPRSAAAEQAFRLRETPDILALRSSIAYVVDQNTSDVLFDKNSRAVAPIASITKLMTAMVVLDSKLPLTDMIEVSNDDRDYEKNTSSRLSVGAILSREDMLHIALMASENRAAAALSRYYPGGRPAFLAAMNEKAKALGMLDTHFKNPTGLTSQNVSSARDLVKMVKAAYQYPLIREFSTDQSYEVYPFGSRKLVYNSTNALVRNPSWDIGLQKTGFINEAGECLVMQTSLRERPVIMVLLDSSGKYSRFADATRLRTWVDNGGEQRITSADAGAHGGT